MNENWLKLMKPKRLEIEEETHTDFYGKFVCEPLERGYGITLGNSLRRVLLSSLTGAAISSVRIKGVLHEFSTIPGVKEEIAEIILNLKKVQLKLHDNNPRKIRIDAQGKGEVTAGDIITDEMVVVLNPDLHIATLSKGAKLEMEMVVKLGRGYVPAEMNKDDDQPIGTIPIDSIFSPIRKVSYRVSNARVGQRTDYDKLTMEVWTNGNILPEDAVAYAAGILQDQLSLFINIKTAL